MRPCPTTASITDLLKLTIYCPRRYALHVIVPGFTLNHLSQRSQLNPVSAAHKLSRRVHVQKRDWAHVIDVNKPMKNFHTLVPEMAHKVSTVLSLRPEGATYAMAYSTRSSWIRSRRRLFTIWKWAIRFSLLLIPLPGRQSLLSTPSPNVCRTSSVLYTRVRSRSVACLIL